MAKIGCLKPFRGHGSTFNNTVLEDGEIAFDTNLNRIFMGNGTDTISNLTAFIDPNNKINRIYKNYNETSYTTIQEAIEGEWTSFDTNSYNTHIIGTLVLGRSYSCIIHKPDNNYGTVLVSVYKNTGDELYFGSIYGGIWVWKKVISGVETSSIYQSSGITLATGWWCRDFRIDYVKLSTKVKYKVFSLLQLQNKTIAANSKEIIATIDNVSTTNAIFKPATGSSQWILCSAGYDTPVFCYFQVTDNGNITIYNPTSSAITCIECAGIYI